MPKPSSTLSHNLSKQYLSLNKTRLEIDSLRNQRLITKKAKDRMYESLFLNSQVLFESFLEDLFIGLLVDNKSLTQRNVTPRVKVKTHSMAREIIIGPEKLYLDWIPYERTIKRAKLFFREGRPFVSLSQQQKDLIHRCHIIRNAIAHKSDYSKQKFESNIIATTTLLPREKNPTGYLQKVFRISPPQTYFENLISQLSIIAHNLTT